MLVTDGCGSESDATPTPSTILQSAGMSVEQQKVLGDCSFGTMPAATAAFVEAHVPASAVSAPEQQLVDEGAQRAEDEKLLAMLHEMAKDAFDNEHLEEPPARMLLQDCGTLWDELYKNGNSELAAALEKEEPPVRTLLQDCGTLWDEVQAESQVKKELQARLKSELLQIQERSERQYQESSLLKQRLVFAKKTLAGKLQDATTAHQDLRCRVADELRGNERLRLTISEGVRGVIAHAEELGKQIAEVGEQQAQLVEELQSATEQQAQLQSELQSERVATWRQSTDVVMAFARGSTPPMTNLLEVNGASQPATLGPMGRRGMPAAAAAAARAGLHPPAPPSPPSSASSSRRTAADLSDKKHEDLHMQLCNERSSWLRARVARSEEQSQLERQCFLQAQRIVELGKELVLEETQRSQLDQQLQAIAERVASAGLRLSSNFSAEEYSLDVLPHEWQDNPACDAAVQVGEVEQLRRELWEKEAQRKRLDDEECQVQKDLNNEQVELQKLQERLRKEEAQRKDQEKEYAEAQARMDQLRSEVRESEDLLRQEEDEARKRREHFRQKVQENQKLLKDFKERGAELRSELEAARGGCFRRRRQEPSTPTSPAMPLGSQQRGAEATSRPVAGGTASQSQRLRRDKSPASGKLPTPPNAQIQASGKTSTPPVSGSNLGEGGRGSKHSTTSSRPPAPASQRP